MRTLILDGTNLFIRSLSVDSTTDSNGVPIGGASGFLRSLRNIIRLTKPQKVICVFDGQGGSIQKRKENANYKNSRRSKGLIGKHYKFENIEKAEQNIAWQFRQLNDILECLPICTIVTDGYEADDCIGYISQNASYFGITLSVIVTCDKDYYQLINKNTVIFNPIKRTIIDTESLIKETGYHPNNWLFFKSINGDSSDNLKGVRGFGEKTIAKLFDVSNETELTIDSIRAKLDDQKIDEKSKEKYKILNENIQTISQNWKIMSLREDVMMSTRQKDQVTHMIESFKPTLNRICFYKKIMTIGSIPITQEYLNDFVSLRKEEK